MKYLRINPSDNVLVALEDIAAGETLSPEGGLTALADIPRGHKVALEDIPQGSSVVKYGYPIGNATKSIKAGEHVHTSNVKTRLEGLLDYNYQPSLTPPAPQTPETFMGFHRENGDVGIRNEIWIIPTVGCVNSIAAIVEKGAQRLIHGSVEGVYSFQHPYGCSQLGDDALNTQRILCGLANHPNAGGVLVLALGCENNTVEQMKEMLGGYNPNRIKFVVAQEHEDEIAVSLKYIGELVNYAASFERQKAPVSKLVVGLKCGGSDGLSGITANPLTGVFSDRLIAQGGSTILTEVPEMFGAETILMNRCASREVFDKTVDLINDFKAYFMRYNQTVYENPSPGNKQGGITTLEDKSLGCTQKGGTAVVEDVLRYGEKVKTKGLNLLQGPGNDLVASTALAASGAHIVLFTTGRGTPFGAPIPTVKISSNTPLANRKADWIDFDAGRLVTGSTMEQVSDELFAYICSLASGEAKTKNEAFGIRDLAIFKDGVTL